MKWSLTQLKKFKNQSVPLNERYTLENGFDRKDVLNIGEVHVTGDILVGAKQTSFDMLIETELTMLDSRTAEEITVPLSIESVEIFDETVEEDDDLDDNIHYVDHTVNLAPVVRELIVVNIPSQVTNSDNLDQVKGSHWSLKSGDELSESEAPNVDPRLSKLQSLFNDEPEESKED